MLAGKDRNEWLQMRAGRIGGSEIASVVGLNPWQSNVDLWELKTGRKKAEDIDNQLMAYGRKAEKPLRCLFGLDFPQYNVFYWANNLWVNDKYPFAHASLDGWTRRKDNDALGVLEIKTATISSQSQKAKWDGKIPDNYYCQLLWYMGVTEAQFADLKAQLKWERDGDIFLVTKHFHVEREEVEDDIQYLLGKGEEFYSYVQRGICPPLVLPEI